MGHNKDMVKLTEGWETDWMGRQGREGEENIKYTKQWKKLEL